MNICKKFLLSCTMLLLAHATSNAQVELGATGGPVSVLNIGPGRLPTDPAFTKPGIDAGVFVRVPGNDGFFFQTGISYSSLRETTPLFMFQSISGSVTKAHFSNQQIQLPLLFGYNIKLGKHVSLYPNAGIFGSYLADYTLKINGTGDVSNEKVSFIKDLHFQYNRIALGFSANVGVAYHTGRVRIALEEGGDDYAFTIGTHTDITKGLKTLTTRALISYGLKANGHPKAAQPAGTQHNI